MNAALSGSLELKPGAPAQFKLSPLVLAGFPALGPEPPPLIGAVPYSRGG